MNCHKYLKLLLVQQRIKLRGSLMFPTTVATSLSLALKAQRAIEFSYSLNICISIFMQRAPSFFSLNIVFDIYFLDHHFLIAVELLSDVQPSINVIFSFVKKTL